MQRFLLLYDKIYIYIKAKMMIEMKNLIRYPPHNDHSKQVEETLFRILFSKRTSITHYASMLRVFQVHQPSSSISYCPVPIRPLSSPSQFLSLFYSYVTFARLRCSSPWTLDNAKQTFDRPSLTLCNVFVLFSPVALDYKVSLFCC